ncbi:MAG: glucose-6-phosphate dehydrogenase assembly protein OpcA [Verrucomicrobiales bacterium]
MSKKYEYHPVLGRKVPIGDIDRELRRLWDEDEARTNASLINLAVYSECRGALEANSEAVRELTREHACRAILIGINRDYPEASIEAWITAHCHLLDGEKSVCCEQLAFALKGRATGRLRNTVFAHLNSDLPLTLWWQGELSPIFSERLYSLVDRFVIDSSDWADPVASFARVQEAAANSKDMVIQDLSWTRSQQFRVSVAAIFDDPIAMAGIDSLSKVEIVHHPKHRLAALQMLAWLSVQARWSPGCELDLSDSRRVQSAESFTFESRKGVSVLASLRASDASAPVGRLKLEGEDLRVEVSREAGGSRLMRCIEAPGHRVETPGPVNADDSLSLVGEQLSRGGKNSLYRKILPRFLSMLSAHLHHEV